MVQPAALPPCRSGGGIPESGQASRMRAEAFLLLPLALLLGSGALAALATQRAYRGQLFGVMRVRLS
jgi:hypothetical protein